MLINYYFFIITISTIFCVIQIDTCLFGNFPKYDSEFNKAVNLNTGFEYPKHIDLHKLGFNTIKKLLHIETLPMVNTMEKSIDIMYCDLACGNMYVLLNYLRLCKNIHDSYLSESITGHMLASLFKINKTIYVVPFWHAHMYILYSSRFRKETEELHMGFIKEMQELTISVLRLHILIWCRENNGYNMTVQRNDELNLTTRVQETIKKINGIQEDNDILLENEAEKNWASLKSIYLHKIIEDESILKTIIMTFGDQSKEDFNVIYGELCDSFNAAKNYYYQDCWIIQLKEYLEKMLNIIRTIALHLIRKHMFYADRYWKSNCIILRNFDVGHSKIKMLLLKNNFFKSLFRPDDSEVLKIVENLTKCPKVSNSVNVTHIKIITEIEHIMKTLSPKFVIIKYDTLFKADFLDKIRLENEKHSNGMSEKDSNKIKDFTQQFNSQTLSDNYTKIISYLRYLETTFEEYNIETTLSYTETFKHYNKIVYHTRTNTQAVIKF